jgi:hypothetical protein
MPEGFTIHGYAGPRLRGAQLLAGFADGYFVVAVGGQRRGRVGEVARGGVRPVRRRRLDAGRCQRRSAYVSSYSGGLYALDPRDGRCAGGWGSRASAT